MSDLDAQYLRLLEAVLFASAEPIAEKHLADRLPDDADLAVLLEKLQGEYAERGVNVVKAGKSWAIRTAPDLASKLTALKVVSRRLSRAAVETLAIIAYHQPVTRGEIEEIRGVGMSKGTLDVLLEAGWIRPRGRRQTPGRPTTWGTTDAFLDHFGLESLGDLPGVEDLKAAGLLDSGPAIDSFRESPAATADGVDEVGETGEGPPEPLDPGDSFEPDISPG
jgi:segregation and condensation protein B